MMFCFSRAFFLDSSIRASNQTLIKILQIFNNTSIQQSTYFQSQPEHQFYIFSQHDSPLPYKIGRSVNLRPENLPNRIDKKLIIYFEVQQSMDPNEGEDIVHSPKEEVDYSKWSEAEREAEFRRKRQEYVAEKMNRKKEMMKMKRQQFGESSSDDSDENGGGSRSSGSSAMKSEQVKKPQLKLEITPNRLQVELKNPPQQLTPTKKKSESLERIPVMALSKRGNEWTKDVLVIGEKTIIIQNLTEEVRKFSKIKIIAQTVMGSPFKIKVTLDEQEMIFSVSSTEEKAGLPIHYYTFAKLTQLRLIEAGIKLRQPQQQKIAGIPESLISGSFIYGKISKKSQVLGNWQQRFILINKEGIFSYKKFNQKHSMFIAAGSINELWTRFQVQDGLLIVKIWHSSKKTEFGFPLTELLGVNCWMYCFYLMMGKAK